MSVLKIKENGVFKPLLTIKGADGVGIPTGGKLGQVLAKKTGNDYDTEWVEQSSGSTNDYTDEDKAKLEGIEEEANKYILPVATSSSLGGIKKGPGIHLASDGTATVYIIDNLTDSSTDKALSSKQGKVLNTKISTKAEQASLDTMQEEIDLKANSSDMTTELAKKVDKTTTIAGINLQDNITIEELATALKDSLKQEILQTENPIGHIRIETTNVNPANYLGFGTWDYYGSGKVLVGVDINNSLFNTVEKSGGSNQHVHATSNHTLTTSEIPNHTHTTSSDGSHSHTGRFLGMAQGLYYALRRVVSEDSYAGEGPVCYDGGTHNHTLSSVGGGSGHNHGNTGSGSNVQEYVTCYFWKRIS